MDGFVASGPSWRMSDVYRRDSTNPLENPNDARLVKDNSALNYLENLLPCIETRLHGLILETDSEELMKQRKSYEVELWKSLDGKDSYFDQVSKEDNIGHLMIDLQAIDYIRGVLKIKRLVLP